ncbi:MAG: hypothetical protein AAB373_03295 [Patescibacteria group bacterium]
MSYILFLLSLVMVIKSAEHSIKYSNALARNLNFSKYVVGFLIVSLISILPETFVAIASAIQDNPEFGLGTLVGSNVADLTLIFFIITLFAKKSGIKVNKEILSKNLYYLPLLSVPIMFGLNGQFTRLEGLIIFLAGALYFYRSLDKNSFGIDKRISVKFEFSTLVKLLSSLLVLLVGAYLTVKFGISIANELSVPTALISIFIVGLGTTLPELFFSIQAIKKNNYSLAIGDLLGTVISDATIVIGLLAMISPFYFDKKIIFVTGICMLVGGILLFFFMDSGRKITKTEGLALLGFYAMTILLEIGL